MLSLSGNPIKVLDKNQLASLVNLRIIQLNNLNELKEYPSEIFKNNANLEEIYIRSGHFKSLNQNIFVPLTKLNIVDIEFGRMDGINKSPDLFRYNVELTRVQLRACFWWSTSGPFQLPKNAFSSLGKMKFLDLASNHLDNLLSGIFENNRELEWLSLINNDIKLLDKHVFSSLKVLNFLSLTKNNIETLPTELFSKNTELATLKLNGNKIQFIHQEQFISLAKLQKLDLSDNPIKQISFNHFIKNSELTFLNLRKTEVKRLNKNDFGILAKLKTLMWDDPAE